MKRFAKTIMFALILSVIPARIWAQDDMSNHAQTNIESHIRDYENGFLFNVFEIENVEERVQLASALATSDIWLCNPTENPGELFIRPNSYNADIPIYAEFEYLRMTLREEYEEVSLLPKEEFAEIFNSWAQNISDDYYNFLISDYLDRANHCMDADPFCTSDVYTFPSTNSGYSWSGPDYGCLGSSPTNKHSFWYYMRIGVAGNITIKMEAPFDIDFALWGPFTDQTTPCPTAAGQTGLLTSNCTSCPNNTSNPNFYPSGNLHDCSFSAQAYEYAHVVNGQVGQYYILLITNYNGGSGNITFQKYAGDGETDCGILPPLVNNEGPYCVGETIHLSAQGQAGATYSWTGPGNFSSNQQNPTRPNCTMAMAGTYTCTITVGTASNSATTEVVIYPQPTANFNYTSVCKGTPTQFTSTSTTNPSGQQIQSYQWTFGDGQTGTGQNVTHTYAQAGNYQVTLNVTTGNGHCTSSKTQTVPVYAAPVASATAQPSTVIYGGTATLTANAGATGTFNFHWEPANMVVNANAQTTQTVPLQATQTYTVTVTNPQGGCSSTAQVTVSMEGSNMTAMASADQYELCEGESTTLHAQPSGGTGNYTFNWSPANTLSDATIQNPVATPPVGETTYTCAVSDGITNQNVSVTIMVHPNEVEEVEHTICENDIYDFYGENVQTPGVYEHHTQTEFGCDKLIRLHLYNWDTYETPITDHFCQGEHYQFFDQSLSTSGIYYHTLESVHGCDSVIRLNLIQDPSYEVELWESTCEGGPGYYYNGDYLQPSAYPYVYNFESVLGCDSVVSLHIEEAEYNSKTYSVSLCATEYTWASNGVTYYETGTYYDTLSFPNSCDSTLVLNLELRPSYDIEVHVTSCDSYHWKNDAYNVDMTFNQSTVYTHPYVNSYGCDSEATLYLTINDHDDIEFTVSDEENCDEYFWDPQGHEIVYTDHNELTYNMTGTYHRTYKNIYDCDSLVTMYVQFEYTPHPTEIYPMDATNTAPHWVVTATEFQINAYDFNLWDTNPNCHWDSVTWNFAQPVNWILEPFGEKNQCCKVYVLSRVEDTVWLEAHAYNRCAPQDGITQRYWLISSFIGIDEDELSTGSAAFDVIPNPNNGQMQLNLERLTGKIDIKVYDMKGTLIDQFEAHNSGSGTYDYNMKGKADGIYFFVATSKEGTVARKVVVQK
ncbi:MAG: PKD domain-containing protein [Bacteroidales bacterium]|nr:PKD domain-containing protein [Bacteroidales bacterium]